MNVIDIDQHWMNRALEVAKSAMCKNEVPVGCVLVVDEKEIAVGHNETNATHNATRHAEFVAIDNALSLYGKQGQDKAMDLLRRCTVYVTIEPCIMCTGALQRVGVSRVVFGAANERFGGCGTVLDVAGDTHFKRFDQLLLPCPAAVATLKVCYAQENQLAPIEKRNIKSSKHQRRRHDNNNNNNNNDEFKKHEKK